MYFTTILKGNKYPWPPHEVTKDYERKFSVDSMQGTNISMPHLIFNTLQKERLFRSKLIFPGILPQRLT